MVTIILGGSLGSIPICLKSAVQLLSIYYAKFIPKLQKGVLLSSSHILHQFVNEHYPKLLEKLWDNLTSCCHDDFLLNNANKKF